MHDPLVPSDRQRTFDASPSELGAARGWLRDTLRRLGADEATTDRLSLALSELASNIVQHGPRGSIGVTVDVPPGWWELCISGPSVPSADVDAWSIADADRSTGRGLGIVRAVTDEVDLDRAANIVRCRVQRPAPGVSERALHG